MHLSARSNPHPGLDYLVEFSLTLAGHTRITLRYVPDKHVLETQEIESCAEMLHRESSAGLEPLAHHLIEAVNNAVVPRWVQVEIVQTGPLTRRVVMEDRQPKWDNAFLFSRMQKL